MAGQTTQTQMITNSVTKSTIKHVDTHSTLDSAIHSLKTVPAISNVRVAVRVDHSAAILLSEVTLAWWLIDVITDDLLEYGGPFESEQEALEEANELEKWGYKSKAALVILLDSESV